MAFRHERFSFALSFYGACKKKAAQQFPTTPPLALSVLESDDVALLTITCFR